MSSTERYARIKEIFLAMCELPPEDRKRALDESCAGDDSLRLPRKDSIARRLIEDWLAG